MSDVAQTWMACAGVPFVVSSIAAYPVYRLLLAMKSRQTVSQYVAEHAHKQGTPTMGGIITVVGFLAACLALNQLFATDILRTGGRPDLAIPILFFFFAAIGFVDDYVVPRRMKGKRGLGWIPKLLMQMFGAIVPISLMSIQGWGVEMLVAAFLVLFFSNAYNFADGLDWLAGSLLIVMVAGYAAIAHLAGTNLVAVYLVALAVASLPFMALNKPKAKLFMGDVGALPIGAVVGLLVSVTAMPSLAPAMRDAPSVVAQPTVWLGLAIVSLMMVAELVPVPLQILSVKLRGKRLFTMTPIHHAYQKKGWPETRVVAVFVLFQAAFALIGAGTVRALLDSSVPSVQNEVER